MLVSEYWISLLAADRLTTSMVSCRTSARNSRLPAQLTQAKSSMRGSKKRGQILWRTSREGFHSLEDSGGVLHMRRVLIPLAEPLGLQQRRFKELKITIQLLTWAIRWNSEST